MVSAINTALVGLDSAGKQLEAAAKKIADPSKLKTPGQNGDTAASAPDDITDAAVDLKIASYDFKANLKTIKVADNVEKSLLDILS